MSMSESEPVTSQPLTVNGHMNLGHTSDVPLPDRFTAPDNARTVPQQMSAVQADEEDNEMFHGGCYDDGGMTDA